MNTNLHPFTARYNGLKSFLKEYSKKGLTQRPSKSHAKRVLGPLSLHEIYISNGFKQFKVLLQLFYGNKANSNKTLRKSKKGFKLLKPIFGIERFYLCLILKNIFVYFYFIL